MAIALTLVLAALSCAVTVFLSRRYVKKTYTDIDRVLDSILAKGTPLEPSTEKDTRLSKLTHKAAKAAQLTAADLTQLGGEKLAIQRFISDISHQTKTPLSGIAMYTDLLLEGNLSAAEQQEFLLRTRACTEKLQWMMDSLVKMSRLEVGAIALNPVPTGIKQTLSQSIGAALSAAAKKNITIHTAAFTDTKLLHDRKWTAEAMTNILENAIKYSAEGGEIHICLEPLASYTKISLTDFGIGVPQEEWNAIFKRFYRGKNTKETDGAGLGLYLAAQILEKQGGYILVDSKPGCYTTFSLFLQNCKNLP